MPAELDGIGAAIDVDAGPRAPGGEPARGLEPLLDHVDVRTPGLAVVYRALDGLVARFGLEDAWLVVDDPDIGHQLFRAARRPVHPQEAELLFAAPGLYTRPPLPDHAGVDVVLVHTLAALALQLDLTRYAAGHDHLTGLLDRRGFEEQAASAIARSERHGWRFALVLLDVDGLKHVNDTQGHTAGDTMLRELGRRLRRRLRVGDIAGRVGGDEFALVLPELDDRHLPTLLDRVRDHGGSIAFSAGVAHCPDDGTAYGELYDTADQRLLAAKQAREEQ
jgi:diguanylate cyclase (GGDEF)-like protein